MRCTSPDAPGSRYGGPPTKCVQDSLHIVPGRLFPAFDFTVGLKGSRCFDGSYKESGHGCFSPLEERAGPVGLVLPMDVWRPLHDVREVSPLTRFVLPYGARARGENASRAAGAAGPGGAVPCHIDPKLRASMPPAMARRLCLRSAEGA